MGGTFSAGGLISGIDSNTFIEQIMQIERQPIVRMEERIKTLEEQQSAVRDIRTELFTLRNRAQDFRFDTIFNQFESTSSEEDVLTADVTGQNPVIGSYSIEVTQLASATIATSSSALGAAIDPNATLDTSGMGAGVQPGTFTINGVAFTVDPTTDSLNNILSDINAGGAGVLATYDAVTDTVTFENATPGDDSIINFGASDDDSTFLSAIAVKRATQSTGGNGSTVATSTRNLGAIDPTDTIQDVDFAAGAITSGSFQVNGATIVIDVTTDSISDVVARINESDAGVTASYDTASDTIRVVSDTLGSRSVKFTSGTSNFLDNTNLVSATQQRGNDAQFRVDGGALLTRNTNEVDDVIGGVTLTFKSTGTSEVTISLDEDGIVEDMTGFVDAVNSAIDQISGAVGANGDLSNDASLRVMESLIRSTFYSEVTGIGGTFSNLIEIGFSTGNAFDAGSVSHFEFNTDTFLEALRNDRTNVEGLFTNAGGTGIADVLFERLDEATRTTGFLHQRAREGGTIDDQISALNDRIDRMEQRLVQRENRLRLQFSRLEQLSAQYQNDNASLARISGGYGAF